MLGLLRTVVAGLALAAGQMATWHALLAPECQRAAGGGAAASSVDAPALPQAADAHAEAHREMEGAADAAPCAPGYGLPIVGDGAPRATPTGSRSNDVPEYGASAVRAPPHRPPRLS